MKHTPGPWTVELDVVNNGDIHVFAPEMLPIADIDVRQYPEDTGSVPREVALANASLIAAAPDLLEALKVYVEHFGDPLKIARKAIAKAEGESK